jgi:PBSX family phage terminase large subunit
MEARPPRMTERHEFTPHSEKQERAIFSEKRILLLATGTQYGKTQVGAMRMKMKMHTFSEKDDAFIITAPNYKIMSQSSLPAFLRCMDGFGTYNKKEDVFEMYRGGRCYLRTETDPDSIVGITNVRHIWGDEAGKYRLYFWENIQNRADFTGCGIDLTTSPYALNWVYKELIKPWKAGTRRDDLEVIQAASWENPYHSLHDPVKRSEKRATMDLRRFNMAYGGEWGRMEGLVYDCWDDGENMVPAFLLPVGTKYYGGIDWGYNPDPFAMKIRAITPDGRHYGVSEFVKTRLTITDIVQICQQKRQVFGVIRFFCDPSQPGYIEELNRNGVPAEGADNDIRRGIDLHYELIKTRKYKEFEGTCPYSQDERESYHYPEPKDLRPDEDSKEQLPVDQSNHCMDVDRYLTLMTYRRDVKYTPRVAGEGKPPKSRLEQLQNSYKRRELERLVD